MNDYKITCERIKERTICRKKEINSSWGSPDIGLNIQNFKSTVLNMFKWLKKPLGGGGTRRMMSYQMENINKDIKITKKESNKNSGVEECNHWNEKLTRVSRADLSRQKKDPVNMRLSSLRSRRKKEWKKWTESKRPVKYHQTHQYTQNRCPQKVRRKRKDQKEQLKK